MSEAIAFFTNPLQAHDNRFLLARYLGRMKILLPSFLACLLLVPAALAEEPKIDLELTWHKDPTAQFVFFSVLEGCYRDGLPRDAAKLMVNPDGQKPVKRFFVFRCELCHAVHEAFKAYAAAPDFSDIKGTPDFGGKEIPAETLKRLKSERVPTRVYAMGSLVRPWILERADRHKLDKEERAVLQKSFAKFAGEGHDLMMRHRKVDPIYKDWSFYGTCQACEAAKDFR